MNTVDEKMARHAANAKQGAKSFIEGTAGVKQAQDNFTKRQQMINKKLEAVIAANVETRDPFAERRVRNGKTRKDRENGNHKRNHENKQARGTWCQDTKARAESFPSHTCNGKRSVALRIASGQQK